VRIGVETDAAPLSTTQLRVLAGAAGRELGWGLRAVHRELRAWRRHAHRIPDPVLREDALRSLADKRAFNDGAAFFWILPERRNPQLLTLLVAFQVMANFLDQASERGAARRGTCGGSLMLAFLDAVDIERPLGDWYADHPWHDDDGYLRALVLACRTGCAELPGYGQARDLLVEEARHAGALELDHDPDPRRRAVTLERWAAHAFGPRADVTWFELTAGASTALPVIVLLALAADATTTTADLHAARAVYSPWIAGLSTMLDSYVDQFEDAASGLQNYLAYYDDAAHATQRIGGLIDRSLNDAANLRRGESHVLIVAAMIAMFLSRDSARGDVLAANTRELGRAGGALTRLLIPILRTWRVAYRHRAG
jgi:tetraprenyl-beta-curcumene synthase